MKRSPERWRLPAILLAVWVVAGAYLFLRLDRDWIPIDEGTLAQSAERVLAGELPHVDFNDPYTGGLAFLHAMAFRVLGTNLYSIRLVFFLFAMLFVPAIFAIAVRIVSSLAAGALTLLCVAWSLPNYVAGVPSWYNLFFATFGILALLKAEETKRWPWYAAAGVAGGLSILVKSIGVYYVVAALLSLVYGAQVHAKGAERSPRPGVLGLILVGCLLALAGLLLGLVGHRPTAMDFLHFALPGLLLIGFLLRNECHLLRVGDLTRLRGLLHTVVPFGLGVVAPIAVFLIPFAAVSGLGDLFRGVFLDPQVRFRIGQASLPPVSSLTAVIPLAALTLGSLLRGRKAVERILVVPLLLLAGALIFFGSHPLVYTLVWQSLRPAVPLATILGCSILAAASNRIPSASDRMMIFLLVSVMALTSLVQFPFSIAIYFCYVAPLVILALASMIQWLPRPQYRLFGILLGGLFAFAVLWLHPASSNELGFIYAPLQLARLDLPRGGLRVSAAEASQYQWVVQEIRRRSEEGDYIYAAPDAPEIYFLAARRNPTRTFSDVFDPDFFSDPVGRNRRILAALEEHRVRVVVLKRPTEFTKAFPKELLRSLTTRYPNQLSTPYFLVRWRDG